MSNPRSEIVSISNQDQPRSWLGSISNSMSSVVSYGRSATSNVFNAGYSIVSAVTTTITNTVKVGYAIGVELAAVAPEYNLMSASFNKTSTALRNAKDAVHAPYSAAIEIIHSNIPSLIIATQQSITGKILQPTVIRYRPPSENIADITFSYFHQTLPHIPGLRIPYDVHTQLKWRFRQEARDQGQEELLLTLNSITFSLANAVGLLKGLQKHLITAKENLIKGRIELAQLNTKIQNETTYIKHIMDYVTSIHAQLSLVFPALQSTDLESLQQLLSQVDNYQAEFENFKQILTSVENFLQVQGNNAGLINSFNQQFISRVNSLYALSETCEMLAESLSQWRKYQILNKISYALAVSSIAFYHYNTYWSEIFTTAEQPDLFQPSFSEVALRGFSYGHLALAASGFYHAVKTANKISLRKNANDIKIIHDGLSNFLEQVLRPTLTGIINNYAGTNWPQESYANRNRAYHFLRRNLLANSALKTKIQNTILNLAIQLPKTTLNKPMQPIGKLLTMLGWMLLVPFDAYQKQTATLYAENIPFWHLNGMYRQMGVTMGLRDYFHLETSREAYYLADYQLMAPLLYFIEAHMWQDMLGNHLFPLLISQYAHYRAHITISTMNQNNEIAAFIEENIDKILKGILFTAQETPAAANVSNPVSLDILVEGLMGNLTQKVIEEVYEVCAKLGRSELGIENITQPPEKLNIYKKFYGQAVDYASSGLHLFSRPRTQQAIAVVPQNNNRPNL